MGHCREFGDGVLQRGVTVPESEFFPEGYSGSEDDVRVVFGAVCGVMGVAPERMVLEVEAEEPDEWLRSLPAMHYESSGAAGHWQRRGGRTVVTVQLRQAREPIALVATIAHELGHERLLGEGRIEYERKDGEPLTDLCSVFFGMGIFAANAAFEFHRSDTHYGTTRLGYLTEPMYGYALARYAWLRGESSPGWAKYLDVNPRTWMKQGLRYLEAV